MAELTVLLLGNADRPELAEARDLLQGLARVIPVADLDAAAAALADEELAVDAVVVAQAYPGQFSWETMDRLSRLAPLARVVSLLGSWCEGEVRSGRPWPGAVRVYWHQWPARCQQELSRLGQGLCGLWSLPATAADEERFLALADQPWPRREGLIAIRSESIEMQDWLARACRRAGYSADVIPAAEGAISRDDGDNGAIVPEEAGGEEGEKGEKCEKGVKWGMSVPRAVLFDAIDCRGEELLELKRVIGVMHPAPVVVLMSFPRVEDRERLLAAGVSAVLSKPLVLEDLFWQIDQVGRQGSGMKDEG